MHLSTLFSCFITMTSGPEWADKTLVKQFIRPRCFCLVYASVATMDGHGYVLLGPSAMVDGRRRRSRWTRPEREGQSPSRQNLRKRESVSAAGIPDGMTQLPNSQKLLISPTTPTDGGRGGSRG